MGDPGREQLQAHVAVLEAEVRKLRDQLAELHARREALCFERDGLLALLRKFVAVIDGARDHECGAGVLEQAHKAIAECEEKRDG